MSFQGSYGNREYLQGTAIKTNVAVLNCFENSFHIFGLPPSIFNTFWHPTIQAGINCLIVRHNYKHFTCNSISIAQNYGTVYK
jgi:hypothetical protein